MRNEFIIYIYSYIILWPGTRVQLGLLPKLNTNSDFREKKICMNNWRREMNDHGGEEVHGALKRSEKEVISWAR